MFIIGLGIGIAIGLFIGFLFGGIWIERMLWSGNERLEKLLLFIDSFLKRLEGILKC